MEIFFNFHLTSLSTFFFSIPFLFPPFLFMKCTKKYFNASWLHLDVHFKAKKYSLHIQKVKETSLRKNLSECEKRLEANNEEKWKESRMLLCKFLSLFFCCLRCLFWGFGRMKKLLRFSLVLEAIVRGKNEKRK